MDKITIKNASKTKTVSLSDLLEKRTEFQTISDDAPLLAFTIEDGVINPENKKSNKRDFLIKDKNNKRFALTEKNDIIYNPANVVFGAIHINSLRKGVVSPIYKIFKCINVDPSYMDCVVTRSSFIHELSKYTEGSVTKLRTLAPEDFLNLKITLPENMEEQEKIGTFIKNIQIKIEYEKKKVEKLRMLKASMLTKMFPKDGNKAPKFRFKGFNENWKQYKLNELCNYTSSSLTAANALDCGKYQLYDANSKIGYVNNFHIPMEYITIIKDGAGVGRIRKLPKNTAFIGTMGALTSKNNELDFLYYLLENKDLGKRFTGSTVPHIYFKDYGEERIFIPKQEEQCQIGHFFNTLDQLIILRQHKYKKLVDLKKALLEKLIGGEN